MDCTCSTGSDNQMILCANPQAQFLSHQTEIEAAVLRVLRGNQYILGPEVEAIEAEFADYIGVQHAIGVANGTDALELALRVLGISQGDEVITVSHTAVATIAAIEASGATPVLVDIEPDYYTMDPERLNEALSPRTRAVIPVHIYGQSANLDLIQKFCQKHGLALIEDVSQAHGGRWRGKRLGSYGLMGCFSCYPTKNLGALGDAGLITTNDSQLARKLKAIRQYGWEDRISVMVGRNSRLDELQAAVLRVKLRYLDRDNQKRQHIAAHYREQLVGLDLEPPAVRSEAEHVYHLFVIQHSHRDQIIENLRKHEIYAGIHYPVPIHQQPAYGQRMNVLLPITDVLSDRIISMPIYPEVALDEIKRVSSKIREKI